MSEKETNPLGNFEDIGPDTDFSEFEAFENSLSAEEKAPRDSEIKAPKKSAKAKAPNAGDEKVLQPCDDTNSAVCESKYEMKELFVPLPQDATTDSFTISINLKPYVIKYGEPNLVPSFVYNYYHTMQKQKSDHLKVQRALQS